MRFKPQHFESWVDWAKANDHGFRLQSRRFFSHELADDGFTLAHADDGIRQFWIDHCIATPRDRRLFWRGTGRDHRINQFVDS